MADPFDSAALAALADLAARLEARARPIRGEPGDYDRLLERVGDARIVLLGEASHGTHEFYAERHRITRRLVEEKGFDVVAVEADWPDAYRVNRYVRGQSDDGSPEAALSDFQRFPTWMWRNTAIVELVRWLRSHNDERPDAAPAVGFYGLDLYSLRASMHAVIDYLDTVDPEAAGRARRRYACFDHFGEDAQSYGYATARGGADDCEDDVVRQLEELRVRAAELARRDGRLPEDEHFYARQNAALVRNAERYYRAMYQGRASSWNLRDQHMADTLDALLAHFDAKRRDGRRTKAVVWAHNSHIGDARSTEMSARGEHNVGQLVRQRHGSDAVLVGFMTHTGTVTAAQDWGAPALRRRVVPSRTDSHENLLHRVGHDAFSLITGDDETRAALAGHRLERAIGVIYRPGTERLSHYFGARIADQFDALIHVDTSRAVEPLERTARWDQGEDDGEVDPPETFPTGI